MFVKLVILACSVALTFAAYNGPLAGGQPAALYPAGVDPKACPNFPDCSNPAVAVNQIPEQPYAQYQNQPQYQPQAQQYQPQYQPQPQQYQTQYQPQPQQYQPQYQPQPQQYQPQPQQYQPQYAQQQKQPQYSPEIQNALNRGEYIGDGDYHGEGLAEALAPEHEAAQQRSYNTAPAVSQYNPVAYSQAPVASQYNPAAYSQAQYSQAGAHAQPAQIPAGVDASSCPNYPFCS